MTQDDIAEGRATPKHRPSDLAGAVYKVTKVHSRQYQPLEGDIFERDGLTIANTYPANTVPERKFSLTVDDKRAIDLVKGHIAHLLDDERDQRLFTSWLSYVVSNPGHKVNWAVLLQGTEGDGKSFFSFLLRAVMGVPNVSMLNASSFQSNFTGWAVGQCVTAVEEIRLQGESRYDILNKIKPFITNPVIEVHAKGKTQFTADNTTNYILFTNFKDALPLNSNDRRYCVFFSKWQNREDLDAFVNTHPNYYRDLYRAIEMHPRAIRGWLMDYELDAEFEAKGNAPITKAHSEMVANSMSEVSKAILELVSDNNYPTIGQELIVLGDLNNAIIDSGMDPIAQVKWPRELSKLGYYGYPTRVKIDGSLLRIYVKDLAKFGNNCDGAWSADTYLISKYLTSLDKTCKIDPFEDDEL
jgi:hypothetical protein